MRLRKIVAVVSAVLFIMACLGNAGRATALEIDCGKLAHQTVTTTSVNVGQTTSLKKVTVDATRTVLASTSTLPRTVANVADIKYRRTIPEGIRELIEQIAQDIDLDPKLVVAVAEVESGGNPWAVSRAGALGVMQLMPATARALGVNPYSLEENIRGGCMYLKQQLERYNGNIVLALAAYNAGPGAVERHKGIPPYQETRRYIVRVLSQLGG